MVKPGATDGHGPSKQGPCHASDGHEYNHPMRIILANPRGFCAGVHMAVDVVDQLLDLCPDVPVYVYHEIVHNKHVVQRFVGRGARFVEDVASNAMA